MKNEIMLQRSEEGKGKGKGKGKLKTVKGQWDKDNPRQNETKYCKIRQNRRG